MFPFLAKIGLLLSGEALKNFLEKPGTSSRSLRQGKNCSCKPYICEAKQDEFSIDHGCHDCYMGDPGCPEEKGKGSHYYRYLNCVESCKNDRKNNASTSQEATTETTTTTIQEATMSTTAKWCNALENLFRNSLFFPAAFR